MVGGEGRPRGLRAERSLVNISQRALRPHSVRTLTRMHSRTLRTPMRKKIWTNMLWRRVTGDPMDCVHRAVRSPIDNPRGRWFGTAQKPQ